jgi:hypothetical protein
LRVLRGGLQICGQVLVGSGGGSGAVPYRFVSVTVTAADLAEPVMRVSPGGR